MALNPQNDREWIASQHAIAASRKDAPVPLALATGYLSPELQRLVAAAKAVVEIDALYDKLGYEKEGLEWDCALIELSSALRPETDNT